MPVSCYAFRTVGAPDLQNLIQTVLTFDSCCWSACHELALDALGPGRRRHQSRVHRSYDCPIRMFHDQIFWRKLRDGTGYDRETHSYRTHPIKAKHLNIIITAH
jgi:hypothetical protein